MPTQQLCFVVEIRHCPWRITCPQPGFSISPLSNHYQPLITWRLSHPCLTRALHLVTTRKSNTSESQFWTSQSPTLPLAQRLHCCGSSTESRPPVSMVFALEDGNKADFLLPCLYPYPLLSKADRVMSSNFNSTTFFLCLKLFSDFPKW